MLYREYGKTGIKLSSLGFGCMRFPESYEETAEIVRYAIDNGVNYFDTAYGYPKSEEKLGQALKDGYRDKIYISTKNPLWDGADIDSWKQRLETSLERLQTDHIDFYNIIHSMEWKQYDEFLMKDNNLNEILKYKEQGVIRHIAFSCHDKPENVKKILDTGLFEGMLVQYNIMNRDYEDSIAYAHEKGCGVIIMGPVAGGILGVSGNKGFAGKLGGAATPDLAIRFVLSNPNVTVALSGMGSMQMVKDNIATTSQDPRLSQEEIDKVLSVATELKKLSDLYCTGCRYCMPCPKGIDIPANFWCYNVANVYGAEDVAKNHWGFLSTPDQEGKTKTGDNCVGCKQCMKKCPQKLNIPQQLKQVTEYFKK